MAELALFAAVAEMGLVAVVAELALIKLWLHERLLAYLSPDTVTGDDGRHTNRCRGGCRLKWNMSQFLLRSDTVIYGKLRGSDSAPSR